MVMWMVGGRAEQSSGAQGGQDASARLLSTLLTEMDGLESATGSLKHGFTDVVILPQATIDLLWQSFDSDVISIIALHLKCDSKTQMHTSPSHCHHDASSPHGRWSAGRVKQSGCAGCRSHAARALWGAGACAAA